MGQLFEQDRRQPNRHRRPDVVQRDFTDHVQQRQIRFRGGLVKPRFTVRIAAVVQDVGEVAVEDNAEAAERLAVAHSEANRSGVGCGCLFGRLYAGIG